MAQVFPIAGSKLYIGNRVTGKGTVEAADFTGTAWTEVGGWASAGTIGDTQEVGEQSLINENRMRKFKTILNAGTMENQFVPMATDPGQILFKQAIEDCQPWSFKIEWGGDCAPESVVTISVAAPGVVTWANHGLLIGQPVIFTNEGGALPTGLTAGTVCYVIAVDITSDTFSVSATPGGAGIETTDAGTGVNTVTAPPAGMTDLFFAMAMPGARSGGDATAAHLRTWSLAIDSNILEI